MSSFPTHAVLAAVTGDEFDVPFTGNIGFPYDGEAAAAFIQAIDEDRDGAPVFDLNGTSLTVEDSIALVKPQVQGARMSCSGGSLPFPGDLVDEKRIAFDPPRY